MASRSGSNRTAIDLKTGLVSRTIFVDHEVSLDPFAER